MARPLGSKNKKGLARVSLNCLICEKQLLVQPWESDRKYCSRDCFKKAQSITMVGNKNFKGLKNELHPNWKGGIVNERKKLKSWAVYKQWRTSVFRRDDYICQHCGVRGGCLEAHHIKPWASFPELRFEQNNGLTLCRPCHVQVTWGD